MIDAEPWGGAHRSNCNADGTNSANIIKPKKGNKIPQETVKRGEDIAAQEAAKRGVVHQASNGTGRINSRRTSGTGVHQSRRHRQMQSMQFNAMMARLGMDLKDRLQEAAPSSEDIDRTKRCYEQLEAVIAELGPRWRLEIFGSIASRFLTGSSDLDVTCVRGPKENEEDEEEEEVDSKTILLDRLSQKFRDLPSFSDIEEIPSAKVPILRLRFEGCLDIDLSCQNTAAIQNTQLLGAYAQIDHRIMQLGIAVKLWAKAAKVCGATERHLSSYTFTLLMIYFLQVHEEVLLPPLNTTLFEADKDPAKREAAIAEKSQEWSPICPWSLPHLLFRFFYFYRWQFEWGTEVASIRLGRREYARDEEFHFLRGRHAMRIHVEDPYVLERNLHCVLGDPEEDKLREAIDNAFQVLFQGGTPVGLQPSTTAYGEPVPLQLSGMLSGENPYASPHFSPHSSPALGPGSPPAFELGPAGGAKAVRPGRVGVDEAGSYEPHPEPRPAFSTEGSTEIESSDGCPRHGHDHSSSGEPASENDDEARPQWWQNLASKGLEQAFWANGASQDAARPRVLSMAELESQMVPTQEPAARSSSKGSQGNQQSPGQWWLNLGSATIVETNEAVPADKNGNKKPLTVQDLEGKMNHDVSVFPMNTGIYSMVGRSFSTRSTGKIASRLASKYFGHVPVPVQ